MVIRVEPGASQAGPAPPSRRPRGAVSAMILANWPRGRLETDHEGLERGPPIKGLRSRFQQDGFTPIVQAADGAKAQYPRPAATRPADALVRPS